MLGGFKQEQESRDKIIRIILQNRVLLITKKVKSQIIYKLTANRGI